MDQTEKDNCCKIWYKFKMGQNNLRVLNAKEGSLVNQAQQTK